MVDDRGAGAPTGESWRPTLGAWPDGGAYRFRVWSPGRDRAELVVVSAGGEPRRIPVTAEAGYLEATVPGIGADARYGYVLDDGGPFPDPASRAQPDGVHGLSATVDPGAFQWSDAAWRGVPLSEAIFYELHVGTFAPGGRFESVIARLPYLVDLGITVIELMPVAACPGTRNWGYDGASLFAPSPAYGSPDDLRRLVDAAHAHGLAVVLDVVYNHFGPDGAYAFLFSPAYASARHHSPWGAAVNFDGEGAEHVRAFVIENALHWLHEYHIDGLRLDATHAIVDDSPRHVIAELVARARASLPHRTLLFVAEDDRNLAGIVRPPEEGGWGCDAVWADDFHHQARRMSAGDREAYYQDFSAEAADLATTIRRGWFYVGQPSAFRGEPRGSSPDGIPLPRMVICLQNHDQVGNRALGERLNHQVPPEVSRALAALLLTAAETPLLFMGQEWAADTPFLYFTDHHEELGRLVTAGRRREFARFAAFSDDAERTRIPDPQARATFEASCLDWTEPRQPAHAAMRRWYQALLRVRRTDPGLDPAGGCEADAPDTATIALTRGLRGGGTLLAVVRLGGAGLVDLTPWMGGSAAAWSVLLTSGDAPFQTGAEDRPEAGLAVRLEDAAPSIRFDASGAVLLRSR